MLRVTVICISLSAHDILPFGLKRNCLESAERASPVPRRFARRFELERAGVGGIPVVLAEVVLMRLTPPSAFLAWVWYAFYVQAEFPPCLKVKDGSKGTLYACIIFSKVLL